MKAATAAKDKGRIYGGSSQEVWANLLKALEIRYQFQAKVEGDEDCFGGGLLVDFGGGFEVWLRFGSPSNTGGTFHILARFNAERGWINDRDGRYLIRFEGERHYVSTDTLFKRLDLVNQVAAKKAERDRLAEEAKTEREERQDELEHEARAYFQHFTEGGNEAIEITRKNTYENFIEVEAPLAGGAKARFRIVSEAGGAIRVSAFSIDLKGTFNFPNAGTILQAISERCGNLIGACREE